MLAGLFALVLLSEFAPARPRRFTGDLAQALPEISGWTRREIPIAGSSAAIASAQGILNFSQAKQILYTRNGAQLLVYVAYWEPGKVSVVDAGSHNPDSCWVNNGCVRTERLYAVPGRVGERELLPYESGQYIVPNGGKQNVAFWHLVNGEPNRYEDQQAGWRNGLIGRIERLPLVWKDIREYGINQIQRTKVYGKRSLRWGCMGIGSGSRINQFRVAGGSPGWRVAAHFGWRAILGRRP